MKVAHTTHEVKTRDNVAISLDLYSHGSRDRVLVICPGFFQSKDTPTFQRLANLLAASCDVISMDFRGHGRSGGLFTFSACEQADLAAVLRWAQERYAHVGVLGFSLGAATVINLASHQNGIRSVIAVSAPAAFEEIEMKFWTPQAIETGIRGLEPGAGCRPGNLLLKKERPIESIRNLASVPVLFIHGTQDVIVSHHHSERLYQAVQGPKQLILIEDGGHAEELFRCRPEEFLPPIHAWLKTTLLEATPILSRADHADGYFKACHGLSLYYQRWVAPEARAPIVIVHGAGEHSGRYAETGRRLNQAGYAVYALDLPGHGRSSGTRGHIRCFGDYIQSIQQFTDQVVTRHHTQKPILIGHSLGGLIATFYAAEHLHATECLVLSSPIWGLNVRIPLWKRTTAQLLSPLWPSLTMERPHITGDVLSHDPNVATQYAFDPLVHFRASVRLYTELQRRFRELPQALAQLRVPVLVLQAGDDLVASPDAVRQLFNIVGSKQKRLIVYDGYYHEVFNEVDKERVFGDLLKWLQAMQLDSPEEGVK